MDISWDDVRLFLAIAEAGSLTGAARALRVGQPTVTRRLAELELRVGEALFRRSVEGASLTPAGARMLEPARRMAEWAGEVQRAAAPPMGGPAGRVRVTANPFLSVDLLAPFAGWLAVEAPKIRLEVSATVRYVDIGRGEADIALRSRPAHGEDLVTVASITHPVGVFTAPGVAARLGPAPTLAEVPWVAWCHPLDQVPPNPQLASMIPNFEPAFSADDWLVKLAAAEAGAGAMVLPILPHRFSRPRPLVQLPLPLGPYAQSGLCLVCARSSLAIPRVRFVVEALQAVLEEVRATLGTGAARCGG